MAAEVVDLLLHSAEEEFSRGGQYPGPLKLQDFLALSPELNAHVIDLPSNLVEIWHVSP